MKEFEQIQMEGFKWYLKIDIATQGENVSPMAPSFQDIPDHSCWTWQEGSDTVAISQIHEQSIFTHAFVQPELLQATPSQQFGFRVPCTALQAVNVT